MCPLKTAISLLSLSACITAFAACSSNDPSPSTGIDASSDSGPLLLDASADTTAAEDANAEDAEIEVDATNGFKACTETELQANPIFANGADIRFTNAGVDGGALVYTNNCARIPKGKSVGWYGDFEAHPLTNDGENGTPVPTVLTGADSGRITFPNPGKYSFHCVHHPATMYGTIEVEP